MKNANGRIEIWVAQNGSKFFAQAKSAYQPSVGDSIFGDAFIANGQFNLYGKLGFDVTLEASPVIDDEDALELLGPADEEAASVTADQVFEGMPLYCETIDETEASIENGSRVAVVVSSL